MTIEADVLDILREWSPDVTALLRRAGYFRLDASTTTKEEITQRIGFGRGTRLYRQLQAASYDKNWQVAKIVLTEDNLIELKQGARAVAKQLDVPFSIYDWHPLAQDYLQAESMSLVKTLTRTDLNRLLPQMQAHFGLNERTFQKKFADDYPCAPSRVSTIFRTEKNRALNASSNIEAKSVGATKKIWRHSHGPNPRLEHLAMDGEERDIDAEFSDGEMYPEMINCRCHVDYKFDESDTSPE
jgi:hypothetical protein